MFTTTRQSGWATKVQSRSTRAQAEEERSALFVRLVDRELGRAYRTAGHILGSAADAEEAAQEAILHAWRAWPTMRDPDRFGAWFERIVVNACLDQVRRRHGVRLVDLELAPPIHGHDPFAVGQARDEVGRALAALPVDQRAVVVLRFWRELSLDEIADRLGVPPGTVKSRLHYGLRTLRTAMERTGEPGDDR